MRTSIFLSCMFVELLAAQAGAQASAQAAPDTTQMQETTTKRTATFTGKLTNDRVRMRLQPSLDAYIFKELNKDDMVLVTGEVDEFYAVMPPKELKGYIFRTYVLDGVIEGSKVNVRLEPEITSPVVTQLSTGDTVQGVIAPQNNKWLEIALPKEVRFYVAKDFVDKAGDATLIAQNEEKQKETATKNNALLIAAESAPPVLSTPTAHPTPTAEPTPTIHPETSTHKEQPHPAPQKPPTAAPKQALLASSNWTEQEDAIIRAAIDQGSAASASDFYAQEAKNAATLRGVLKPYNSFVKNKPGDFVLIDPKTNLPTAYLYSTSVDLQSFAHKEVSLQGAPRPNNFFAFDAYIVLAVDE